LNALFILQPTFEGEIFSTNMRHIFGRGKPLQAAIYACCLAAFLFFGYDQGVFGGILENPHWRAQFNDPEPVIVGITVSSYCLGALTGCAINFCIGDILGRRRMIWLAMALIIVGATLQTSAFSLAHLIGMWKFVNLSSRTVR
jgi:MFS family permease